MSRVRGESLSIPKLEALFGDPDHHNDDEDDGDDDDNSESYGPPLARLITAVARVKREEASRPSSPVGSASSPAAASSIGHSTNTPRPEHAPHLNQPPQPPTHENIVLTSFILRLASAAQRRGTRPNNAVQVIASGIANEILSFDSGDAAKRDSAEEILVDLMSKRLNSNTYAIWRALVAIRLNPATDRELAHPMGLIRLAFQGHMATQFIRLVVCINADVDFNSGIIFAAKQKREDNEKEMKAALFVLIEMVSKLDRPSDSSSSDNNNVDDAKSMFRFSCRPTAYGVNDLVEIIADAANVRLQPNAVPHAVDETASEVALRSSQRSDGASLLRSMSPRACCEAIARRSTVDKILLAEACAAQLLRTQSKTHNIASALPTTERLRNTWNNTIDWLAGRQVV